MLGIRLDAATEAGLARLAKRVRRPKSDIAREVVARHVRAHDEAFRDEARRQSLHVAKCDEQRDWDYWEAIEAEDGGWR